MGLSLTQVEFFLENISNSILLSRLDHGLGYATYNAIKVSIHCKPMITNDRLILCTVITVTITNHMTKLLIRGQIACQRRVELKIG